MIERLASALGRNDEVPNIELAESLCENNDSAGIKEIVDGFTSKNRAVANDCIKVLYEIGARKPELISQYAPEFLARLNSKNNRLAWGSMTALATITPYAADVIFDKLHLVVSAYENGSVITVDNSISVFAELCKAGADYSETVLPILIKHLQTCRPKEVPQHAERASVCFNSENAAVFIEVLEKRISYLTPSQQKRINKLINQLNKQLN
jgi:hypothetical protein